MRPELSSNVFPIPFELIPKPHLGRLANKVNFQLGAGIVSSGGLPGLSLELIPNVVPIPFELIPKLHLDALQSELPLGSWGCGWVRFARLEA